MNRNVHVPFLGEERTATFLSLPDPIRHRTEHKRFYGFQTGDMVRARVPGGRKTSGVHVGRALVRASGKFDLVTKHGRVAAVHARYCTVLQHGSGYSYGSG